MPKTDYSELPYPSEDDAPDVPKDMQRVAERLDARTVLRADDSKDRDNRYDDAPDGSLCVGSDGTVWVRGDGKWMTMWEPRPNWIDLTLAENVDVQGSIRPQVRVINNRVEMQGALMSTSSGAELKSDVDLCYLPEEAYPKYSQHFAVPASMAGARTYDSTRLLVRSTGEVRIADQDPNGGPSWVEFGPLSWWIGDAA